MLKSHSHYYTCPHPPVFNLIVGLSPDMPSHPLPSSPVVTAMLTMSVPGSVLFP